MGNINKLIDIEALTTYNDQLHTDLDSTTIAHKSGIAAANGTYQLYVFDGVNLKPSDLTVTKNGDKYDLSHHGASTQISVSALNNITIKGSLNISNYLSANTFSCYAGTIKHTPASNTDITNKEYVDSQVKTVSTNLSSMYAATTETVEPSE